MFSLAVAMFLCRQKTLFATKRLYTVIYIPKDFGKAAWLAAPLIQQLVGVGLPSNWDKLEQHIVIVLFASVLRGGTYNKATRVE